MGYNIKDLDNAGRNLHEKIEKRSQQKGEELANHVIKRTSEGRGVWVLILWPAWLLIFIFSGMFFSSILKQMGVEEPMIWGGFIGGVMVASIWYKSHFTMRHPFFSSVFGYFSTAFIVVYLTAELGLSL